MKKQEKHEHEAIMRKNKNNSKEQKKENDVVQLDEIRLDFELTTTHKIKFSAKAPRRDDCF
jgi:hypothetical protein